MWKRVVLALGLVLFVSIALCPRQIVLYTAKRLTIAYFQNNFGSTLNISSVAWEDGSIVFKEGELAKELHFDATFKLASFQPHFSLRDREIGGIFHINGLKVSHQAVEPLEIGNVSKSRRSFFASNMTLHLRDCQLTFADSNEQIELDFTHHFRAGHQTGNIVLHCDDKPLDLLFSSTASHFEVATAFQHHQIAPLQKIFNAFIGPFVPAHAKDWQIKEGVIDGRMTAEIEQGSLYRLIGSIQLQEFTAHNAPLAVNAQATDCCLDFEMEKPLLPNWSATVELKGGRLGLEEAAWQTLGEIRDVNTTLRVCEGKLDSSSFCGTILGLEGDVTFDWHKDKNLMEMVCVGTGEKIIPMLPSYLQEGFEEAFGNENFTLTAALHRQGSGLLLEGEVAISLEHKLQFGCQFGGGQKPPVTLANEPLTAGLMEQFCLSEKRLGYFRGENLPLSQFLAPFLLKDLPFKLEGIADIEGTFDERYIVLFHKHSKLLFSGEGFELSIPTLEEQGVHYVDLQALEHVGYLPVKNAKYIQHSCKELTLQDVSGTLHFENNKIELRGAETVWQGLPLAMQVELNIHAKDDVDLVLGASCKQGSLLAGQKLLDHFTDCVISKFPLQGTFSVRPGDLEFVFHLNPEASLTRGTIKGDSCFSLEAFGVLFEEGITKFTYDMETFALDNFEVSTSLLGNRWKLQEVALLYANEEWNLEGSLASSEKNSQSITGYIREGKFSLISNPFAIHGQYNQDEINCDEIIWGAGKGHAHMALDYHTTLMLAHPQMGRCELVGGWDGKEGSANLTLEALDLDQLTRKTLGGWGIQGTYSGQGIVNWKKEDGFQVEMRGEHRNLSFGSLQFGNGDSLQLSYQQNVGMKLEGLEALGEYKLGALHYDPKLQHAYFEGFDFNLSPDKLPWLAVTAGRLFPDKISPKMFDLISEIKHEEPLCGRLWIDLDPNTLWLHLKLQDGTYYFEGQPWEINDFSLTYDPTDLEIKTGLLIQNVPSLLHITADSQTLSCGRALLQEASVDDLLTIDWFSSPNLGYQIEKARGTYSGLVCDLYQDDGDDNERFCLKGKIVCHPEQALALLPSGLCEVMHRLEFGGEYKLDGTFTLPKHDLIHPKFVGELSGQDCAIVETKVATLTCQCVAKEKEVVVSDVAIRDWAGSIFCDQIIFYKDDYWQVHADHIAIRDFRPSRLDSRYTKKQRGEKSPFRSLFISSCELNHFKGYLSSKESFVGSGQLSFTNLSRRTFISNLMMIPAEITARIGLDLTNFVPARGTIHYNLGDGRLFLNEFEEVYSDAKRSRFYLVNGAQSYILLNGECHLSIKMKQYNLLMKLAELFTVTVKGNILDPQYLFSGQSEKRDLVD